MEEDRIAAGSHVLRRCAPDPTGAAPSIVVRSRFRFIKRFLLLPSRSIAVDHQRLEWGRDGCLEQAIALARGDAACGHLFSGECRLELAPKSAGAGWLYRQSESDGEVTAAGPANTVIDDFWSPEIVTASAVANPYTGRLWRIAAVDGRAVDRVGERTAWRYRIKSKTRGFLFFASRFERVLWFSDAAEVLRVCEYQIDYGFTHLAEFVRADLGVVPRHDCGKWFE
jgi:hypothetical protein